MPFGISMISHGDRRGKWFERGSPATTHPFSTGKLKAKPKEKRTVTGRRSSNPSTFLYEDGKIGSVHGCANSGERRRGEEILRECTLADTSLAKNTSTPDTR